MKLTVNHPECGRDVLVQQILASGGHCPWDGKPFNKDYTAVLAESLGAMEIAATALVDVTERLADVGPELTMDPDQVLGPIRAQLDRLNAGRTVPSA